MVRNIHIRNFKSVTDLKLELGRITVLIGENGSGKSNILEGIAMLGAALANKLDNEFLVSRGIRVTDVPLMLSAFNPQSTKKQIRITASSSSSNDEFNLSLASESGNWKLKPQINFEVNVKDSPETLRSETQIQSLEGPEKLLKDFADRLGTAKVKKTKTGIQLQLDDITYSSKLSKDEVIEYFTSLANILNSKFLEENAQKADKNLQCSRFLIFSPENSALRRFEEEGQILPVGIHGEGLFKLIQSFAQRETATTLSDLKKSLELVGWFFDFTVSPNLAPGDNRITIKDRFIDSNTSFDQRSANEGFLFLIFYFAIFLSKETPQFFAIDNIDAALNPKLCAELMRQLCTLAKRNNKQVIFTTHNPSILDGLNLFDEDQRLYTVYRNDEGHTKARRIRAPKPRKDTAPTKLSEAFMRGLIGGLPKNF